MDRSLLVARREGAECRLLPQFANRHGLVTGATGTGKTVTLQGLAQGFSSIGVPVFMADVKGDLAGMACPGGGNAKIEERFGMLGVKPQYEACPVVFWDVLGACGHPVRATVSDMGPLLLSRMLGLNETQEGVLNIVFKAADDNGLALLDLKDLRAMLTFVAQNAARIRAHYGNVSAASVGAVQRGLLTLESQGAERFFGEPMLDIADLMQSDDKGRGVVNILAAEKLFTSPRLYATFLLWMLAELFENLPEVGDADKPKLVFFFDEAHLLFDEAPRALQDKIEQVVRLIRSKGVGVYFVTQSPLDVPETVLGQLGNRVQHALRAFTPRDQKAVRSVAQTMRPRTGLDIEKAITELGVGEALVSLLDEKARPGETERAYIVPPGSRLGPISDAERKAVIEASTLRGHYEKQVDRESAYEVLAARAGQAAASPAGAPAGAAPAGSSAPSPTAGVLQDLLFGRTGPRGGRGTEGLVQAAAKSAVRSIGSQVGRELIRGVLGSLLGRRR
ncbi:MAG: DUF853 family protein [Burkholderiales bacterium]|nr:DUF853 family protein [Burkholderiales bacterium]